MKLYLRLIPFIALAALVAILWRQLFYAHPAELPSPLINETLPSFNLPILESPYVQLKSNDFTDKTRVLIFWATWCEACVIEHPMLMKIKEQYHVPIYGILYKDDKMKAKEWLAKHGNPYVRVGDDVTGDVAIDFGVYGTPETYIINGQGKIIYRHIGIIDNETWEKVLYPIIKKGSSN